MLLTKLELEKALQCTQLVLNFPNPLRESAVYICHGQNKCNVISMATQLICSHRYISRESLESLQPLLKDGGRVMISFLLAVDKDLYGEYFTNEDIDPCTSRQAIERQTRRHLNEATGKCFIQINATRDFRFSDVINYNINDGAPVRCLMSEFLIRFFSCTDIVLPRLQCIIYGEHNLENDNWIDLLSYDYIYGDRGENDLLEMFTQLHSEGRIPRNDNLILDLTSMVLQTRLSLHLSRISNILIILRDVRKLFEYITCGEYTVWFLLLNDDGDFEDIDITTQHINFQRIRTIIELRNNPDVNYSRMYWTDADKYVQELFLVSIQLAFASFSKVKMIYLHSLEALRQIETFDTVNESVMRREEENIVTETTSSSLTKEKKNYLERIVEMCLEMNLTAIVEYEHDIALRPSNACLLHSRWCEETKKWQFYHMDCTSGPNTVILDQLVGSLMECRHHPIVNSNGFNDDDDDDDDDD